MRFTVALAGALLLVGTLVGCSFRAAQEPSIEFTRLPPSGEGNGETMDPIEGRVKGARRGEHVVLFAKSGVWWVQPLEASPLTAIGPDSTWKNSTHPGNAYAALLVTAEYRPQSTVTELPRKGGAILAVATAEGRGLAKPPAKTLHFSGYEWTVRHGPGNPGGSLNHYDPANAFTDDRGFLHLRITGEPNRWMSAEVNLAHSLGYGSYRFVVRDVSHLEPAGVFTISTWDDSGPAREMDIEIGRWGEPTTKNAQFVVQPYYVPANTVRFLAPAGAMEYGFRWEPGRVNFTAANAAGEVATHLFTSGVPSPGAEEIHLNHYVFENRKFPLGRPSEVIVEKFEFLP